MAADRGLVAWVGTGLVMKWGLQEVDSVSLASAVTELANCVAEKFPSRGHREKSRGDERSWRCNERIPEPLSGLSKVVSGKGFRSVTIALLHELQPA